MMTEFGICEDCGICFRGLLALHRLNTLFHKKFALLYLLLTFVAYPVRVE